MLWQREALNESHGGVGLIEFIYKIIFLKHLSLFIQMVSSNVNKHTISQIDKALYTLLHVDVNETDVVKPIDHSTSSHIRS